MIHRAPDDGGGASGLSSASPVQSSTERDETFGNTIKTCAANEMCIGLIGKRGLAQRMREQNSYAANNLEEMSFAESSHMPNSGMTQHMNSPFPQQLMGPPQPNIYDEEDQIIESNNDSIRKRAIMTKISFVDTDSEGEDEFEEEKQEMELSDHEDQ